MLRASQERLEPEEGGKEGRERERGEQERGWERERRGKEEGNEKRREEGIADGSMEGEGGGLSPNPTPQCVWCLLSTSVVDHMTTLGAVMRGTLKTGATIQKLKHKHPNNSS